MIREVDMALALLLEAQTPPTVEAVRELLGLARPAAAPSLAAPHLDLTVYDALLPSRRVHA